MTINNIFSWAKKTTENGKKRDIPSKDGKYVFGILTMNDKGDIHVYIHEAGKKHLTLLFACAEGTCMIVDFTDKFTIPFCPIGPNDPMPKSLAEFIKTNFNFMEEESMEKKVYLTNAFSIQMLPKESLTDASFRPIDTDTVKRILAENSFTSAIGHTDTAKVVGAMLGMDVQPNRISVSVNPDDEIIVAQLTGGRLPEGATEIPEGMSIEFWRVRIGNSAPIVKFSEL